MVTVLVLVATTVLKAVVLVRSLEALALGLRVADVEVISVVYIVSIKVVLATPVEVELAMVEVGVGVVTVEGSWMCMANFKPARQGVLLKEPMDSPS